MTTAKSITSANCINCCTTAPPKPLSRVERTKSYLKASLIKRWKSSKELFTKPLSNFTNSDQQKASARKAKLESQLQNGKFINEKVLDNLDEFERNFLLSAGRKILVRELRKNFEKPLNIQQPVSTVNSNNKRSNNGVVITVNASEPERKAKESNLQANSISEQRKKYANASCQTTPDYENLCYETKTTNYDNQKKCSLVSRHSFYNTYRNEYCSWQTPSQYASNLSLISCGIPSNRERCLEKTINKYNNSMRSSSAVDLSSISAIVLNSAMPTIKRQYSSIINISHANSSQNLTDSPIIDHDYSSLDVSTSYAIYENTKSVQNSKNNHNNNKRNQSSGNNDGGNGNGDNCQPKPSHSQMKKTQNTSTSTVCGGGGDGMNNANVNIHFRNGDSDTQSMIVTNTAAIDTGIYATAASVFYEPLHNRGDAQSNACHFQRCGGSKMDLHGSNVSLTMVNANDSHNYSSNKNDQCALNSSSNCHNRHRNNKNLVNNSSQHHDGNNNNTTPTSVTAKVRKCHSINQIDLGLLKNELDEYIDRDLRITNFGQNTLAQRRCQFENNLKKVNPIERIRTSLFVWRSGPLLSF